MTKIRAMEKWLQNTLLECLGFEIPKEGIEYILSLRNERQFDEHFATLLDMENEMHRKFLKVLKERFFPKSNSGKISENNKGNHTLPQQKTVAMGNKEMHAQKKTEEAFNQIMEKGHKVGGKPQQNSATNAPKQMRPPQQQQPAAAKKKNQFVPLYSKDGNIIGETVMLKGRHMCECQASEHKLINNCLTCGRIVCEQEGSGPCLFCGQIVCSNEEQETLRSNNKKSEILLKALQQKGGGGGESLKKAMEQRDRLLEYDRNSEKRTTVIDDELDYFQENSVWLSEAEREKLERLKQQMQDKKHISRAKRSVKIDFAGREIEEDFPISEQFEQLMLKEISETSAAANTGNNWSNRKAVQKDMGAMDPQLDAKRPIYVATSEERARAKTAHAHDGLERIYNRVQDKELMEMQDMRQCLSMHQPWASLLVAGIKKHEGRVWYTEHRGRLWIASTARVPKPEEIDEIQNFYRKYYNDVNIKFPEYPVGCLLGCVKLEECLPQEEYAELYKHGESESPFVFICSNPERLPVVFPIQGSYKIYQLEPKVHLCACKALLRSKNSKT